MVAVGREATQEKQVPRPKNPLPSAVYLSPLSRRSSVSPSLNLALSYSCWNFFLGFVLMLKLLASMRINWHGWLIDFFLKLSCDSFVSKCFDFTSICTFSVKNSTGSTWVQFRFDWIISLYYRFFFSGYFSHLRIQ